MPRKPELKEWIVRTRETRSFDVDYVVRALNEEDAAERVREMDSRAICDETALLNSLDDMEIRSVMENK